MIGRYRGKLLWMIAVRMDCRIRGKVDGEESLQDVYVESARRIEDFLSVSRGARGGSFGTRRVPPLA